MTQCTQMNLTTKCRLLLLLLLLSSTLFCFNDGEYLEARHTVKHVQYYIVLCKCFLSCLERCIQILGFW
jgi:hypothetical protein